MGGKASRQKGAAFERQICKILGEAYGVELRRTPLSGGWAQNYDDVAGDVVAVKGEFPYCVECKKQEGWALESLFTGNHGWFDSWWEQLLKECPDGKTPMLVFSRNFMPIFVALRDSDLLYTFYPSVSILTKDNIVILLLEEYVKWDTGQ